MKKTLNALNESLDDAHIAKNYILNFLLVIPFDYFADNGEKIVSDFSYYGSIVLKDSNDKLYGLLFKDKGVGEDGSMYMKCYLYRWPLSGVLRGGVTFFTNGKNIGEEVKLTAAKVR